MAMPQSLITMPNGKPYEILKSIEHLVHFAHWAYSNDDGVEFRMYATELTGSPLDARFLRVETPFREKGSLLTPSTTHVHLGIRSSDTLVLAFPGYIFPIAWEDFLQPKQFRGFLANVYTDISFGLTSITWPDADLSNVLVHKGFLLAFNNFLQDDRFLSCIDQLRQSTSSQNFEKIEICGHSLGGALATLCALWCKIKWPNKDITCVTLGSPRVGNQNFVEEFHRRNIRSYRLMLDSDPIPNLPNRYTEAVNLSFPATDPDERRYKHVGTPIWLRGHDEIPQALGENPPSVASEEGAENLSGIRKTGLLLGGFVASGLTGGAKLIWNMGDHSPMFYATTVFKILESGR